MKKQKRIEEARKHIEKIYSSDYGTYKGAFGEILCFEIHSQPINPRMNCKTISDGYETGLTFRELAQKWGITVTFLGELIADHCRRLEE